MKYYRIETIGAGIFVKDPMILAKNSKKALEKYLKQFGKYDIKKAIHYSDYANYSVWECNENGGRYADRRKKIYYLAKKIRKIPSFPSY
jgi:hypothetical protein